ncbi:MAG: hypothetical protein J6W96_06240 [Alphaproteobacteria bacterium]|nr:hypothetical protein [Alphaproteobacteria bacterium]
MNKPKYFINCITVRKYCRDNGLPFGSVLRKLNQGYTTEEAVNCSYKKRSYDKFTQKYGVKRGIKIRLLMKRGFSEKESILRSLKKTELITICKKFYRYIPDNIKELYKEFNDE